ncbi:WD40/YVTN/BNR-like repeat-containing protein [Bergeyella zoohelcum]|nr:YCF48-related protein [Bergeyella zoohelcum]
MHWKEIKTIGTEKSEENIGTDYYFNNFLFSTSNIGFLSGEYKNRKKIGEYKSVNIDKKKDAVIIRSEDSGYHWQEIILGKGEIIDFQKVGSKLFALRRSYHGENAEVTHSHIHISTDDGNTWQEVFSTEETLDNVYFWTEKDGIATMGFRGQVYDFQTIIKTEDGGKSWKKIIIPQMYPAMDFAITKKGILYFLTANGHSYVGFNLMTNEYEEFPLNLGEEPFSVVLDNNDNLYFVTENKDNRNILFKKENKSHSFTKIEFPITDIMINDVWIYDNTISIIVDNNGGACYRSEDYGKTWQKENLPNSFIRNVAFFGKDNIWIRSIPGKMLIRN